jgi:transcriptional regulator with XRE-family HTH domain
MPTTETLSARLPAALNKVRLERGLSVKKLAEKAGMNLSTVQRVLNGDAGKVKLDTLMPILAALGLSFAWLDTI